MSKVLLLVALLVLATTSSVGAKSYSNLTKEEIGESVSSFLHDVKNAKSVSEYISSLNIYEVFKRDHKESGVCFPSAPFLETPSTPIDTNQVHKRCSKGYKLGERHGKKWAKITVRDGKSFSEGLDNLRCLLSEVNPASPDILSICIFKGAKLSYNRWHQRYTNTTAMEEYSSLKVEQGDSSAIDRTRAIPDGTERTMTPQEMEFVKAVGLSEETKAKIDHQ
jgi:hypothetical protein